MIHNYLRLTALSENFTFDAMRFLCHHSVGTNTYKILEEAPFIFIYLHVLSIMIFISVSCAVALSDVLESLFDRLWLHK